MCFISHPYIRRTVNMDILGPTNERLLKEDGCINWSTYLTLSSYEDDKCKRLNYEPAGCSGKAEGQSQSV